MKVWTCTRFSGHYPVGVAAVVVAETEDQASFMLNEQLKGAGLPGDARSEDMVEMPTHKPHVVILDDGNY